MNEKPKILIVDDLSQNLLALRKTLSGLDVEIIESTSGNEALILTLEHDFAIAVIDVQMPGMDGYELVELMRGNSKTKSVPIIFISAIYSDTYHLLRGADSGAVDFLAKPFIPEILLSKVQVFLDLYIQRMHVEYQKRMLQELVNELNAKNTELETEIQQRHEAQSALHESYDTLSRRAVQLEASSEVGRQVTSILNIDELLTTVVESIQKKFGYYYVGIWLMKERQENDNFIKVEAILKAGTGRDREQLLRIKYRLPMSITNNVIVHVCMTEQYFITADMHAEDQFILLDGLTKSRSRLVLPLKIGNQLIGVLDLHLDRVNAFSKEDEVILPILANQITIAIRNANLYQSKRLHQIEKERSEYLAELNTSKDKFFSIVAHDLRGPFQPLLGISEMMMMMAEQFPPDEIKQMSEHIYHSAKNIYNLLENLLEWSRMQMGRIEYTPVQINLDQMINKQIELLANNANVKGIKLQNRLAENIQVYADKNMLDTVLRNLISNALKFTPEGGNVIISVQHNTDFVEVAVSDTGVGISQANIGKLFNIDMSHTTTGTHDEKGTGLGLLICKEMVEKNQGNIMIESVLDKGTTVKFTVPAPLPPPLAPPPQGEGDTFSPIPPKGEGAEGLGNFQRGYDKESQF